MRKGLHTSAGIDSGGLLSCENARFVLAGMLRDYGAYATDQGSVRLDDYSVAIATIDIQLVISLSQNDC